MMELKTIQQKVEEILKQYPGTRDDDRELIQVYYGKYHNIDYYTPFGAVIKNKKLPSFESIRRTRQKVQSENESLRGTRETEQRRLDAQVDFIEYSQEGA